MPHSDVFFQQIDFIKEASQLLFFFPLAIIGYFWPKSGGGGGGGGDGNPNDSSVDFVKEVEILSTEVKPVKDNTNQALQQIEHLQESASLLSNTLGQSIDVITSTNATVLKQLIEGLNKDLQQIYMQVIRGSGLNAQNTEQLIAIGNNLVKLLNLRNVSSEEPVPSVSSEEPVPLYAESKGKGLSVGPSSQSSSGSSSGSAGPERAELTCDPKVLRKLYRTLRSLRHFSRIRKYLSNHVIMKSVQLHILSSKL